jgi:hypothetical protein
MCSSPNEKHTTSSASLRILSQEARLGRESGVSSALAAGSALAIALEA